MMEVCKSERKCGGGGVGVGQVRDNDGGVGIHGHAGRVLKW